MENKKEEPKDNRAMRAFVIAIVGCFLLSVGLVRGTLSYSKLEKESWRKDSLLRACDSCYQRNRVMLDSVVKVNAEYLDIIVKKLQKK